MIPPLRRDIEQLIRLTAAQLELPAHLALQQCEVESAFNYLATSPSSGGTGLFGVTKATETDLNNRIIRNYAQTLDFLRGFKVKRDDWRSNIFAGLMYMRHLRDHFDGNIGRAVAAYRYGVARVDDLVEKYGPGWWGKLPRDPGEYVQQVMGNEAPNLGVTYE